MVKLLDSKTLIKITFLEDVLSITNTLSIALQANKKDFEAITRAINSTVTILTEMTSNQNTIHLKRFNVQNEVLVEINTRNDYNIVERGT